MKRYFVLTVSLLMWCVMIAGDIDISGKWGLKLDRLHSRESEGWINQTFGDSITLPGALHAQGFGDDVTAQTKWYSGSLSVLWQTHPMYEKYRKPGNIKIFDFLQPAKHYIGVAWYKRNFEMSDYSSEKEYILCLERVHWESTLYINQKKAGVNSGLGTAHEYDISGYLKPGKNEIAIRVDNSQVVDVGRIPHSISEQTMAAWNGVLGDMKIHSKDKIWIDDVQIFPDFEKKLAVVKLKVANSTNKSEKIQLCMKARNYNSKRAFPEKELKVTQTIASDSITAIEIIYPFSKKVQSWDEFNPALYKLNIALNAGRAKDEITETFGFRDLSLNGRRFALNGRTISVRGNLNCGEFPVDGLPDMSIAWWRKIFNLHKEWGHNMVRFHSWCPPEAAFIAADEVGIYLQAEASEWGAILTPEQERFITEETDRMVRQYGNHPSWMFFSMGNELRCDTKIMERFIARNKQDQRRFVTGKTNGRPLLESFDFATSHSVNQKRVRHHMGWPPRPETNLLFHMQPNTNYDYAEPISEFPKPFLAHEIGQYCVFPDYKNELPKYTGSVRATVLDIQKDQVEERGMADQASLFTEATGKWQMELLKSEYEAILRTPQMAGFHALSLQDFPGQSHAPVGVFDAFWDKKTYANAEQFRQFCDETVLLARIPKLILQQSDTLHAAIELYNFAEASIRGKVVSYTITDEVNSILLQGKFIKKDYANQQSNLPVGVISFSLKGMKAPSKYTLHLKIDKTNIENNWNFWVFPDEILPDKGQVKVVTAFDKQTIQFLDEGCKVLLLTDPSKLKGELPTAFASMYWTAFGLNGGESMTNSILCDPGHPLFRYFPTEMHSNWQWWDILKYSVPMILDEFGAKSAFPKTYQPVLQAIDSWKVNRKLGLLAECRYSKGKLMISGIDFSTDMENRVATRQLYYSLMKYMNSPDFNPLTALDESTISSIYGKPENNLMNVNAKVYSSNKMDANKDVFLFDGNKSTFWMAEGNNGTITIDFNKELHIKGLTIITAGKVMPQFAIYQSNNGVDWEEITGSSSQLLGDKQVILFNKSISKQFIRINFEEVVPTIAELDVIYADNLPVEG